MKQILQSLLSLLLRKNNKHFYAAFLLTLLLITSGSEKVYAMHAAGGYVSYQWLYGNTYQFTVTFYKDCGGATAAPDSMEIDFYSTSCSDSYSVIASQIPGTGQEIGYPCASLTTCEGGTNPGYRKFVYQTTATMPMQCSDWVISFTQGPNTFPPQVLGRNYNITTLVPNCEDPNTHLFDIMCHLFTESTLDNVNYPTNSSAIILNDPILFACAGQKTVFNLGVTDPDGDTFTYELVNALADTNTDVTYVSPLSGTDPLLPSGSTSINQSTGDITIDNPLQQFGVIDVLIKEYSSGMMVGSVIVDFQVVVQSCSNNIPTLSGINNTPLFADTVCPGSAVSFNVYSNDVDTGQIVTMTWDSGIPIPASFTVTGSQHPAGTFTWTTTLADARPQPYTFTVTVNNNACPINGSQSHSYSIYVSGAGSISLGPSTSTICAGNSITLTASGFDSYIWSPSSGLSDTTGSSVSASPDSTTTYTVTGINSGICGGSSNITVTVNPLPIVNAESDVNICPADSSQLNVIGPLNGSIYTWIPSTYLSCNNCPNPFASPPDTTSYAVWVTYPLTGCSASDTIVVNVAPVIATAGPDTIICAGNPVQLYASGGTNYSWSPSTGLTNTNIANPSDTSTAVSITTYTVTVSSGNCSSTATVSVDVNQGLPLPIIIQNLDTLYCSSNTKYISYQWYDGTQLIPGATDTMLVITHDGNYNVAVYGLDDCSISVGITVTLITGAKEFSVSALQFMVSPDPAGDALTITANIKPETPSPKLTIYNVLGEKSISPTSLEWKGNVVTIYVGNLSAGIYFIEVQYPQNNWIGRFVKE